LLLDRLREKGRSIDAAITHHPEGRGLVNLYEVMTIQADVMHKMGVPINVAEHIMSGRMKEVSQGLLPVNYARAIDAAVLLDIPFVGAHTPADNCVAAYLQKKFDNKNPETISDIIDLLLEIEEYKISYKAGNGPKVVAGAKERRAGRIFVDMTGGTSGPIDALEKLAESGIGTIIGMHMSKDHIKAAEKNHLNVVIAGHMASDVIGLNILLDSIEKKSGNLDVIACSGFTRVKR
ncbi:NGG1p interacting factor NIF3, partial [bacterium]